MANTPIMDRQPVEDAAFSVSARLAMQLGRESISSSIVAILELVKNASDADAENVSIHFVELEGFEPRLVIQDDGSGMTLDKVTYNWMVIGTTNKAENPSSAGKGRTYVGEKGLGRLGLDRLANVTRVRTFAKCAEQGVEIEIDWRKYEDTPDERLETIKHQIYVIPKHFPDPKSGKSIEISHGTILELAGLRDRWRKADMEKLHAELSLLVSPFGSINDFTISLLTGVRDWKELDGPIGRSQLMEAAEWALTSTLSDRGDIVHELVSYDGIKFQQAITWSDTFRTNDTGSVPACGPTSSQCTFSTGTIRTLRLPGCVDF